jgi:hypothetical protein
MSFREISKIIKAYEKKVRLGTKKGEKDYFRIGIFV